MKKIKDMLQAAISGESIADREARIARSDAATADLKASQSREDQRSANYDKTMQSMAGRVALVTNFANGRENGAVSPQEVAREIVDRIQSHETLMAPTIGKLVIEPIVPIHIVSRAEQFMDSARMLAEAAEAADLATIVEVGDWDNAFYAPNAGVWFPRAYGIGREDIGDRVAAHETDNLGLITAYIGVVSVTEIGALGFSDLSQPDGADYVQALTRGILMPQVDDLRRWEHLA